jgi:lipopolysaccharide export system permease protein
MRILDRYVVREFMRIFTLFVVGAPVLFILGDVMENLDKLMDRGLSVGQIALSYLYQSPLFVLYSFPIAALIAAVFTVNRMTGHSEVAAAKAGGVSFYRLFAPLPVLGIVLTIAGLGVSELVPITHRKHLELTGQVKRNIQNRTDFVYRTRDGRVFAIRRLDARTQRIDGLTIEREGNEPETPSISTTALRASYDEDLGWTLFDGYQRLLLGAGVERTVRFAQMRVPSFTETPEQLLAQPKDPEEMRYGELGEFIEIIERSGGEPLDLKVERAQKIAIPVATLVIILFAVPLATSSRRGGSAYGVGVSLAITIFYLMFFRVAGAAGESGAIPPTLAAWLPNLLVLIAAMGIVTRVRT